MKTLLLALLISTSTHAAEGLPKIQSTENRDPITFTSNNGRWYSIQGENRLNRRDSCSVYVLFDEKFKIRIQIFQAGCGSASMNNSGYYEYYSSGNAFLSRHEISYEDFLKLYSLTAALYIRGEECATTITLDRSELKITSMNSKCDVLN